MPPSPTDIILRLNTHMRSRGEPAVQGASADEIHLLGKALSFELPRELALWLSLCRGCELPSFTFPTLLGTHRDNCITDAMYPEWRERGWIPLIGDGCGNYYNVIADRSPAPIAFIEGSAPTDLNYLAASSLFRFLSFVVDELEAENPDPSPDADDVYMSVWFDRDSLLKADPDSAAITDIPRAWNSD